MGKAGSFMNLCCCSSLMTALCDAAVPGTRHCGVSVCWYLWQRLKLHNRGMYGRLRVGIKADELMHEKSDSTHQVWPATLCSFMASIAKLCMLCTHWWQQHDKRSSYAEMFWQKALAGQTPCTDTKTYHEFQQEQGQPLLPVSCQLSE